MLRSRMAVLATMLTLALAGHSKASGQALAPGMNADQVKQVLSLFNDETKVLEAALERKIRIVVLETHDPIARNFIARGVLHTDHETFQGQENGLAAVMAEGGQIDGEQAAVCYVVFNSERAGPVWRNFIVPLAKGDDLHPGAAFLMGHEVGHCLDHHERNMRLKAGVSNLSQAGTFGIQPDAWQRVSGDPAISNQSYIKTEGAIFRDPAQRQYQERVADAFGVLWGWHRNGEADLGEKIRTLRNNSATWSSHSTAPALDGIEQFHEQAKIANIGDLWVLARGFQVRAGVDQHLIAGGDKVEELTQAKPNNTRNLATPDPGKPQPIKPVRQMDGEGRVRFDTLRRFGSGVNGAN